VGIIDATADAIAVMDSSDVVKGLFIATGSGHAFAFSNSATAVD
jgi:glycine/D-amino acid oxidase-like deaminating enzyme